MAQITHARFAAHWSAIHDRQDWALVERQVRHDYSRSVDWSTNPEGRSRGAFNKYLTLRHWAHGRTSELAKYCFDIAASDAQEAVRQNSFADVKLAGAFPHNRYCFLESKIFIDAFVSGQPLSKDTALRIAEDQMTLAPNYDRRQWDGYPQSQYLHAVDLLLLVDEYDRARSMLKQARGLNGLHVKKVAEITKLIAKTSGAVCDYKEAHQQYRSMLDLLRDPNYPDGRRGHPALPLQQLTMACVLQKYFEPGDGLYSLDRAVDLLWE